MELKLNNIHQGLSRIYGDIIFIEPPEKALERFVETGIVLFKKPDPHKPLAIKFYYVPGNEKKINIEQFSREYHILQRFTNNEHIVKAHAFEEVRQKEQLIGYVLIRDYITETLETLIHKGYRFSHKEVMSFLKQMDSALNYLHFSDNSPVIHSDIKPANIGIERQGNGWRYILLDFDISVRKTEQSELLFRDLYGLTPAYSAPEMMDGLSNADHKMGTGIDIYSVGVIALEMLMGNHITGYNQRLGAAATLPVRYRSLLLPLLQTDPGSRASTVLPTMEPNADKHESLLPLFLLLLLFLLILTLILMRYE